MEFTGRYTIPALPRQVWDALNDPTVLKSCIPGCQSLSRTDDHRFDAVATLRIGPVKANFKAIIHQSELDPPRRCILKGEGQGGVAGFARGEADEGLRRAGLHGVHAPERELVIGIQVFQHGRRGQAHRQLAAAAAHVAPGGLLCVRVNSTSSDIRYDHERTETAGGGFTVRYLGGSKTGLDIHYFTAAELEGAIPAGFSLVLPLRLDSTPHDPPAAGQWSQWEAIWQRRPTMVETQHAGRAASDRAAAGASPGGSAP